MKPSNPCPDCGTGSVRLNAVVIQDIRRQIEEKRQMGEERYKPLPDGEDFYHCVYYCNRVFKGTEVLGELVARHWRPL